MIGQINDEKLFNNDFKSTHIVEKIPKSVYFLNKHV